jgi:hypothetical protein
LLGHPHLHDRLLPHLLQGMGNLVNCSVILICMVMFGQTQQLTMPGEVPQQPRCPAFPASAKLCAPGMLPLRQPLAPPARAAHASIGEVTWPAADQLLTGFPAGSRDVIIVQFAVGAAITLFLTLYRWLRLKESKASPSPPLPSHPF